MGKLKWEKVDNSYEIKISFNGDKKFEKSKSYSLVIKYTGKIYDENSMLGLYKSSTTLLTQCETNRVFPVIIQGQENPYCNIELHVTASSRKDFSIISSSAGKESKHQEEFFKKTVMFDELKNVRSYLTIFCIGEFEMKYKTYRKNKLRTTVELYIPKDLYRDKNGKPKYDMEATLEAAKYSVNFAHDIFSESGKTNLNPKTIKLVGIKYFAAGAMENTNVYTFRPECLLVPIKTETNEKERQEVMKRATQVICHEFMHLFYGHLHNAMTTYMRLWVKESFAAFAENFAIKSFLNHDAAQKCIFEGKQSSLRYMEAEKNESLYKDQQMSSLDALNHFTSRVYSGGGAILNQIYAFILIKSTKNNVNIDILDVFKMFTVDVMTKDTLKTGDLKKIINEFAKFAETKMGLIKKDIEDLKLIIECYAKNHGYPVLRLKAHDLDKNSITVEICNLFPDYDTEEWTVPVFLNEKECIVVKSSRDNSGLPLNIGHPEELSSIFKYLLCFSSQKKSSEEGAYTSPFNYRGIGCYMIDPYSFVRNNSQVPREYLFKIQDFHNSELETLCRCRLMLNDHKNEILKPMKDSFEERDYIEKIKKNIKHWDNDQSKTNYGGEIEEIGEELLNVLPSDFTRKFVDNMEDRRHIIVQYFIEQFNQESFSSPLVEKLKSLPPSDLNFILFSVAKSTLDENFARKVCEIFTENNTKRCLVVENIEEIIETNQKLEKLLGGSQESETTSLVGNTLLEKKISNTKVDQQVPNEFEELEDDEEEESSSPVPQTTQISHHQTPEIHQDYSVTDPPTTKTDSYRTFGTKSSTNISVSIQ